MEQCVHVFFIKGHELINTHYLIDSYTLHEHMTTNLDRYICAVSSLAAACIQIHCLEEMI